jgi:hypothetical protein
MTNLRQAAQVAWNKSIRDSVDSLLEQAGYQPDSSARHELAMMNFDATPPQRKPLTDEQMAKALPRPWPEEGDRVCLSPTELRQFARAIEAAHGIKEGT